jgi:hypothetical protein
LKADQPQECHPTFDFHRLRSAWLAICGLARVSLDERNGTGKLEPAQAFALLVAVFLESPDKRGVFSVSPRFRSRAACILPVQRPG